MYCMDGIQLSWLDLFIFFFLQGQVKGIVKGASEKLDLFSYFFLMSYDP